MADREHVHIRSVNFYEFQPSLAEYLEDPFADEPEMTERKKGKAREPFFSFFRQITVEKEKN
jgi:hypothetical protein